MRRIVFLVVFSPLLSLGQDSAARTANFPRQVVQVREFPPKERVWVFIMAGQSNMAGRGLVEPGDTVSHPRILTINKENKLIEAKEPLHFYQPKLTGLDCGMSFARNLIDKIDSNTVILLLPTAVGGSSIKYWLNDSAFNGVRLKSNFMEKADLAKKYGILKGILWHQGESDATAGKIPLYEQNLQELFSFFRGYAGDQSLPVIMGELGSYTVKEEMRQNWSSINEIIRKVSVLNKFNALVETGDLKPREDNIHFDSPSQRILGQRYAETYIKSFLPKNY
ncbi:sialate O-acetylesterase [Flavihumibacter stibioxidans]|uniref:Sialate O-acetylesterase domain-containing protein n=1 Tax=Flavihumibacter stibioxidans TaxID=1834163 RepID=A0ABR7M4I0_9BACT|nr:sialate O-acetylesterase [Flavihumibacter stibioxidans]MBC6489821.1 hypothetical protein [Flavihumibacter stibioxidans]